MIVDKEKILFEDFPTIWCPKCHKGTLIIIKDSVIKKFPSWIRLLPDESETYYDEDGNEQRTLSSYDIEMLGLEEFITTFFLECSREKCKEVISTCGLTKQETRLWVDESGEEFDVEETYYYPKFFYPSIRLFEIPHKTPKTIIDELEKAFSLFWSDPSACANSIRKVLERIIDEIDSSTRGSNLHKRIEQLSPEFSTIKDFLFATKWVGNDGSHQSDLVHYDVITVLRFIEQCLIEIYKNEKKDLALTAQKINNSKKSISKIED